MAVQSVYNETLDAGRVGAIADTGERVLISRTAEVAAIGFGLPVVQGAADDGVWMAKSGDTAILGVSVRDRSATDDEFAIGDSVRVMTKGVIWVTASVAVVPGDTVAVTVATAAFEITAGAGVILIDGARWESTAGIGDLAKIRLS